MTQYCSGARILHFWPNFLKCPDLFPQVQDSISDFPLFLREACAKRGYKSLPNLAGVCELAKARFFFTRSALNTGPWICILDMAPICKKLHEEDDTESLECLTF
jgi:hypothetical protein